MKPNRRSNSFLRVTTFGFTAAVMAFSSQSGSAAPVYWDGGSGNWNDLTKWSTAAGATTPDPLTVPSTTESAVFDITSNNSVANQTVYLNGSQSIGTLTVNNSGRTTISGGTSAAPDTFDILISSGNISVGVAAANKSMVTLQADLTALNLSVGGAATGGGAVYQSGGTVTLTDTTAGSGTASPDRIFSLGATGSTGTAGYGYYGMSGGTLTSKRLSIGARANGTTGVMEVSGASTSATSNTGLNIARGNGSGTNLGLLNVTGGTVTFAGNSAGALEMGYQAGDMAVLNVGGGVDPAAVTQGTGSTATTAVGLGLATLNATGTNAVNLRTNGTLTVSTAFGATASATALINFNGGTLKATPTNAGANFLNSANIDGVTVFSNGGTIDNNGTSITVGNVLAAPAGSGVQTVTVSTQGAGYIGAPVVQFTGGTGRPATAVANMIDDGSGNGTYKVGAITITSPGDFSILPTAVTLTGGSPATAATAAVGTTGVNASGGMGFTGTGTTTLSGANSYAGVTAVNNGTLNLTGSLTSAVTVANGATITGTGSTTGSLTMSGGSTFAANTSGVAFTANGVSFIGFTNLTFNGAATNGSTYDLFTYGAGGVSGLANLTSSFRTTFNDTGTKITATVSTGTRTWNTTSGTWEIGGATTNWLGGDQKFFNGDTVTFGNPASASTVTLNGSLLPGGIVSVNNTNAYTFSGGGSIGGVASLTKDGSGDLTISTANTYSGGTSVNAGKLALSGSGTLGATTGALALGGGTLDLESTSQTVGGVTITVAAASGNTIQGGTLTATSVTASNSSGNVIVSSNLAGATSVTAAGAGMLTLAGANTYTGATAVRNGALVLSSTGSLTSSGSLTLGDGTTNTSGLFQLGDASGAATASFGGLAVSGTGTNNAVVGGNAGVSTLTINSGSNFTFAGILGGGGTNQNNLGLTKSGGGVLILSNTANSYTGQTIINGTGAAGTLQIGANEVIPNASEVVISNGGKLMIGLAAPGSYTETIRGLIGVASAVSLVEAFDAASGGTGITGNLIINTAGGTFDFGGFVRDRGGSIMTITKSGAGTQIVSGTNTYSGTTTISGGTLQIGNGGTTGSLIAATAITNNAMLAFNRSDALAVANVVSGTGAVVQAGTGTATLSGANTYTGNTIVNAGTLEITSSYLENTADVLIAAGGKLQLSFVGTDTVDELTIGGVAKAVGTYGATGSGAAHIDDTHFSGTGTLTVTTGPSDTAYDTWASSKGLTGANNGATQDPDFDGISNILEFVLGGNPLASAPSILPVLTTTPTDFVFTFNRADESEAEATLTFQYGSTLTGWTDVAVGVATAGPVSVTENATSPDTVVVTISTTSAVGGKLFGRLKAVK